MAEEVTIMKAALTVQIVVLSTIRRCWVTRVLNAGIVAGIVLELLNTARRSSALSLISNWYLTCALLVAIVEWWKLVLALGARLLITW